MNTLITGITGQDGSYLAEQLLQQGKEVHGIIRRSSSFNTQRIEHIYKDLHLHYGDMTDPLSLSHTIQQIQPTEIYNLAAQSHVQVSFEIPYYTAQSDALGVLNLLEAVRTFSPHSKIYQASTSEMYGNEPPIQNEATPFKPISPYACAKLYAHNLCQSYRQAYNLFICCGILFNHESPKRGHTFVTQKIAQAAKAIKTGKQDKLILGNINAKRDWGYAPEYTQAMQLMLQQQTPDDYVIATGVSHTVLEFIEEVFNLLNLNWQDHLEIDPRYYRPNEVNHLQGDASKAKRILNWQPQTTFSDLCKLMTQ